MLGPLENVIKENFIPALSGRGPCSNEERALLSLPARYGGLNVPNPMEWANFHHESSMKITDPLKMMIIDQTTTYKKVDLREIKANLLKQKNLHHLQSASQIRESLPPTKQRVIDLLKEKGSSSWLSALPLHDCGLNLNKSEFRDALSLRYGWQLKNRPQYCVCGKGFSTDHAMICPHGGMVIARRNEIRDLTAEWMNEVCRETETEPLLQPLTGEILLPRSANRQDDARVDIKTKGLWSRFQSAFFM